MEEEVEGQCSAHSKTLLLTSRIVGLVGTTQHVPSLGGEQLPAFLLPMGQRINHDTPSP